MNRADLLPGRDRDWLDRRLRVAVLVVVALTALLGALTGTAQATADGGEQPLAQAATVAEDLLPALTDDGRVEVLYFGSDTCPFCQQMEEYLRELEAVFDPPLDVVKHEVSRDAEARDRWERELLARGVTPSGVPTTIIGDRVWVGFDDRVATEVTRSVAGLVALVEVAEPLPPDGDDAGVSDPGPVDPTTDDASTLRLPLLGEVELAGRSAIGVTALIAFVDGFNPCSLWVLAILLAMVLNAGASRGRIVAVGVTFLTVTGLIYGAFIVGIFTVVGLVSSIVVIGWVVGAIALLFGVVNIKDYFAYKQGLSFTIPDRFKPRIYRGGRSIRDTERSLPAVLGTTVVLAGGVALIELPCTMGFPLVWTGTLQTMGIERGPAFAGLLALYLLIYVGLELILFAVVVTTMQVTRLEEKHGRFLKLVGGSLMVVLGVAMIGFRHLLDDLTGLLWLTLASVALTAVLALIQRARTGAAV